MHIRSKLQLRGSLLVLSGARLRPVLSMMFNPASISRSRGWNHGSAQVPGRSTPVYGGGAGSDDTFTFTLPLDADRGFFNQRAARQVVNPQDVQSWFTTTSDINDREDLRPHIDQFKQFVLPADKVSGTTGRSGVPQRVFIDLGSALAGEVGIDRIDEELFRFSNTMRIMKADLVISGHMIEESNVTNVQFLRKYTGRQTDLPDVVQDGTYTELPDVLDEQEGFLF